MASALRLAARRICGRAFQRPPQSYFTAAAEAAVREEQRRLFPTISHGRSSLRRFSSSESPNLVNNKKHVPNSSGASKSARHTNNTEPTSPPPLWSPRNEMFLPLALGYAFVCVAGCYATVYVQTLLRGGPVVWEKPDDISVVWEKPDDIRKKLND